MMGKPAYPILHIKEITWTRSLMKFLTGRGKSSIETSIFLNPKAEQP